MERDELFGIYDDTVVTAWDGEAWIDPSPICVARGRSAVVITAWNPGWERPDRQVNEANNARLEADLAETDFEVWPAVGASRYEDHSEPGFLVWGMTPDEGCTVARRYGQFGIYFYGADGMRTTIDCG